MIAIKEIRDGLAIRDESHADYCRPDLPLVAHLRSGDVEVLGAAEIVERADRGEVDWVEFFDDAVERDRRRRPDETPEQRAARIHRETLGTPDNPHRAPEPPKPKAHQHSMKCAYCGRTNAVTLTASIEQVT